ncbi:MAG TPA: hypothetical protein VI636_14745 [Candidatus Angelobacter sp.]
MKDSAEYLQAARKALVEELANAEKRLEKIRQQLTSIDVALGATGAGGPVSPRSRVDFSKTERALDAVVLYLFHHQEGQGIDEVAQALYKLGFRQKRRGSNIQSSINTHITKAEQSKKEPKLEIGSKGELRLTNRGRDWARTRKRMG